MEFDFIKIILVLLLIFLSAELELLFSISLSLSSVAVAFSVDKIPSGIAAVRTAVEWVVLEGVEVLSNLPSTESIIFCASFAAAAVTSVEKHSAGSVRFVTAHGLCENLDLCCKQNVCSHSGHVNGRKSWQLQPICVHFVPSMLKKK